MSELLWVAVPNGLDRDTDEAIIRLLIVPRLRGDRIDVHGLADWPAILRDGVDFKVATKLGTGTAVEQDCRYVHHADSDVWHQFFDGDAGIVGDLPGATGGQVEVDETYRYAAGVEDSYRALTTALAAPVSRAAGEQGIDVVDAELQQWRGRSADRPPPDPGTRASRPMDFHRSVSMLRQHPAVLMALGLIVELRLGTGTFEVGDPAEGALIAIRCGNPPFLRRMVKPSWTRYEYTTEDFRPAPTPGRRGGVAQGMLNLAGVDLVKPVRGDRAAAVPDWALSVVDVDGAVDALSQAAAQPADPGESATAPAAMPAIRSVGLSLLRPSRQDDVDHRRLRASNRAAPTAAPAEDVLTADDLVLGYRVDVSRDDETWLSLCKRDATYAVNGHPIGPHGATPVREEGQSTAFAAVKAGARLHTDQIVVRWTGWSLALPVVTLVDDPSAGMVGATGEAPYRFRWEYGIPTDPEDQMPALRFGRTYQLRVRVADLAGGGLGVDDVSSSTPKASNAVLYTRYDPVPPPVLVSTGDDSALGPGAAVDRLVIRSGEDTVPGIEIRSITAPLARLALVEQHGVLPEDLRASWDVVRRAIETPVGDSAPPGLADPAAHGVRTTIPVEPGGVDTPITDKAEWRGAWPRADAKAIRLKRSGLHGAPIGMTWSLDQQFLDVTLAPARRVTIELSSTVTPSLVSHLAVGQWLTEGDPLTYTLTGRNPAVSPVRRVVAVHAVRKPLSPPDWTLGGAGQIVRNEHDTFITLIPTIRLDTHSTGQLDVKAEWTDVADTGPVAAKVVTPRELEHLYSTPVDPDTPPAPVIRQEFGDTKQRSVRYTLNAITRFRRYFPDAEDEGRFHWAKEQADAVDVTSSALPPVPTVLGVLPAFAWQDPQVSANRIEHVRGGRRIRVELARPWYQTGDGERLAVLFDGTQTRIGREPLFTTATPSSLGPESFRAPGATAFSTEIGDVRIVTVEPTPGGDRWYADLEFVFAPGLDTYDPFVRLAVARYQPASLPKHELSSMVVTDVVPVLPDRRVVVDRSGSQVRVTVSGTSPTPVNTVTAVLERSDSGASHVELVAGAGSPGGVPAWQQVAAVSAIVGTPSPPLTMPAGGNLRVRIVESEPLQPFSGPTVTPAELGTRNVFLDTVTLPSSWH